MGMATNKLTLKLLIDKKANRVLFAEASKDFVDSLFSLLTLPVGSVIKLLTKKKMVGCIGNLYESVSNLDDTYFIQPIKDKDVLTNPKVASASPLNVPLLTPNPAVNNSRNFYRCSRGRNCSYNYVTNDPNITCPDCSHKMSSLLNFVPSNANSTGITSSSGENGYVKGVVTYMVMDDLTVMSMSTISSITLLSKFNVENVNLLEEKVVSLGMEEGLELLKTSLQSKTVLSQVFLGKNAT
ncbi:hypothetical protein AQUCO_02700250v1 [Aquilegia coerulea]|uniref:DUF674 domain-containing protein n=1 Tax=Aquilegia coerulea TaxID=218851 RepID=A0A2G5D5Y5_AQUCA|nr:hypothetical protein AQUCO_02700250v1 [Aquilegia coerulea]